MPERVNCGVNLETKIVFYEIDAPPLKKCRFTFVVEGAEGASGQAVARFQAWDGESLVRENVSSQFPAGSIWKDSMQVKKGDVCNVVVGVKKDFNLADLRP